MKRRTEGSQSPVDRILDEAERAISEGVREMACRLNRGATSFQQTAENLARAAHLTVSKSKETLRKLILEEGRAVLKAQRRGELAPDCYHLKENVQKARLAAYGEQSAEGQAWRNQLMGLFHESGYEAAWDQLVAWRSTLRGGKREAADRLLG